VSNTIHPAPALVSPLGKHVVLELMEAEGLNDEDLMKTALRDAAIAARATIVHIHTHRFAPQGVSGVAVLAESHISAHTWPELGYGAFDIYTCGDCDPEAGAQSLARSFKSGRSHMRLIKRGPVGVDLDKDSAGTDCIQSIFREDNNTV